MRVLVTGAKGQLGSEIKELEEKKFKDSFEFTFTDVDELNISNKKNLEKVIGKNSFDILINAAAYTAVDKAEEESDLANKINGEAVENLVEVCNKHNVFLIHVSTDYVFKGENFRPYNENDKQSPNSAYGRSKLKGEMAIIEKSKKAAIVRTAWLYSQFGGNFVKTIMKYAKEKAELNVVSDQIGSPTNAADLANGIIKIMENYNKIKGVEIFHYTNEGVCSWYDFAKEIIEIANINCKINPVTTEEYKLPANRPPYSVLSKKAFKKLTNSEIPYWKDSLKSMIKNLD